MHAGIDDHCRTDYMEILPDEKKVTTAGFFKRAIAHYREVYGVVIAKLLTNNGSAFKSKVFAQT